MANKTNNKNANKSTAQTKADQQQPPRPTFRNLGRKLMHIRLHRHCPSPNRSKQLAVENSTNLKSKVNVKPQPHSETYQRQEECRSKAAAETKGFQEPNSLQTSTPVWAESRNEANYPPTERAKINPAAFRFQASLRMSVEQDFFHEAEIIRVKYPRCPVSQSVKSNRPVEDFSRCSTRTVPCH